jgi:hypothetical protein
MLVLVEILLISISSRASAAEVDPDQYIRFGRQALLAARRSEFAGDLICAG